MIGRLRWPAIFAVAASVVGLLIANGQVWFRAGPTTFSGAEVTSGLVQALALLVLVLVLLLLVVKVTGRRIVGIVIALAGVGAVAVGLLRSRPDQADLLARAATSGQPTGAAWLAVASGVVAVAAGVVLALGAASWPVRQRRVGTRSDHPIDVWKAQDRGLDPTSDESAD